jgi:1,4-alpha-glucan branching enzyme
MSVKKQYNADKTVCKVTFKPDKNLTSSAHQVNLTGEFNDWDVVNMPMNKLKNGEYSVTIELENNREYEFKYLIDGCSWLNEKGADKQVFNEYLTENSVIVL